jgi:hypothetical protein
VLIVRLYKSIGGAMFNRKCPKCNISIEYKTKHGYENAIRNKSKCPICSRKDKSFIDESGNKYGKLKVLKRVYLNTKQGIWYECLCDCGEIVNRLMTSIKANVKINKVPCCDKCFGLPKGQSALNAYYLDYKKAAIKRGYSFLLSKDEFNTLIYKECFYCGTPPDKIVNSSLKGGIKVGGIDRIDNLQGYTVDNCVPCCSYCNYAKRDRTTKDFLDWVKRIYDFNS